MKLPKNIKNYEYGRTLDERIDCVNNNAWRGKDEK